MVNLVTEFDRGIGLWFFVISNDDKVIYVEHGFPSRDEAHKAGDIWLQASGAITSLHDEINGLYELAHFRVGRHDYTNLTLGEVASTVAAIAGWRVIGAIHLQTAITIDAQSDTGTILEALQAIAQLAGLKIRAGSEPRTVEIGIF